MFVSGIFFVSYGAETIPTRERRILILMYTNESNNFTKKY